MARITVLLSSSDEELTLSLCQKDRTVITEVKVLFFASFRCVKIHNVVYSVHSVSVQAGVPLYMGACVLPSCRQHADWGSEPYTNSLQINTTISNLLKNMYQIKQLHSLKQSQNISIESLHLIRCCSNR